jgi:5-methylcytosine-specific restriction endonuclease McrA
MQYILGMPTPFRLKIPPRHGVGVCSRCNIEQPISCFTPRKDRPLGHMSRCKTCLNEVAKTKPRDKARHAKERAAHRKKRPDLVRANNKRFLERHPDKKAEAAARIIQWARENPELAKAASANWKKRNPDSPRQRQHNRRAKIAQGGGRLSSNLVPLLMSEQGGLCPYCWKPLVGTGYDMDHYYPVAKGGLNCDDNIQLTCPRCNKKKCNKDPRVFLLKVLADENLGESSIPGRFPRPVANGCT